MPSIREIRERRIAKEAKQRDEQGDFGEQVGKALLGAGLSYATAGLAPALVGGATSLAPTAANVLPALSTGAEILGAGKDVDTGKVIGAGLKSGLASTVAGYGREVETGIAEEAEKRIGEKATGEGLSILTRGPTGAKYGIPTPTLAEQLQQIQDLGKEPGVAGQGLDFDLSSLTPELRLGKSPSISLTAPKAAPKDPARVNTPSKAKSAVTSLFESLTRTDPSLSLKLKAAVTDEISKGGNYLTAYKKLVEKGYIK